jgi:hypothetical protein
MNRDAFLKLLAQSLFPVLRSEGFRGSGSTLRRTNKPIVHVFNVQGSRGGDRCYLNLGAHLSFLPTEGGGAVPSAALQEYHCVFRSRLHPPSDQEFGWSYGTNDEESAANVARIVSAWPSEGRNFFARYSSYPEAFVALTRSTVPSALHPRDTLHYARIAVELGLRHEAIAFAESGLERTSQQATGLRRELDRLLESLSAP